MWHPTVESKAQNNLKKNKLSSSLVDIISNLSNNHILMSLD